MKREKKRLSAVLLAAVIMILTALPQNSLCVQAAADDLATAQAQGVQFLTQDYLDLVESLKMYQGPALTKGMGTMQGPAGMEQWYNLDMTPVIRQLAQKGVFGEYWVRGDGCKMYGPFIMVAANYELHPYATLVETSLGIGIVCDTGGFAQKDPTAVDIAVNW